MIIICPSCKKRFNLDINLITSEGRDLQCGSCEHIWFYKKQEPISETLQINQDISIKEKEDSDKLNNNKSKDQILKQSVEKIKKAKSELSTPKESQSKSEEIPRKTQGIKGNPWNPKKAKEI